MDIDNDIISKLRPELQSEMLKYLDYHSLDALYHTSNKMKALVLSHYQELYRQTRRQLARAIDRQVLDNYSDEELLEIVYYLNKYKLPDTRGITYDSGVWYKDSDATVDGTRSLANYEIDGIFYLLGDEVFYPTNPDLRILQQPPGREEGYYYVSNDMTTLIALKLYSDGRDTGYGVYEGEILPGDIVADIIPVFEDTEHIRWVDDDDDTAETIELNTTQGIVRATVGDGGQGPIV